MTLLVARRDELMRLQVTLGREPADTWRLEPRPDATPEQQAHRKAWMGEVVDVVRHALIRRNDDRCARPHMPARPDNRAGALHQRRAAGLGGALRGRGPTCRRPA